LTRGPISFQLQIDADEGVDVIRSQLFSLLGLAARALVWCPAAAAAGAATDARNVVLLLDDARASLASLCPGIVGGGGALAVLAPFSRSRRAAAEAAPPAPGSPPRWQGACTRAVFGSTRIVQPLHAAAAGVDGGGAVCGHCAAWCGGSTSREAAPVPRMPFACGCGSCGGAGAAAAAAAAAAATTSVMPLAVAVQAALHDACDALVAADAARARSSGGRVDAGMVARITNAARCVRLLFACTCACECVFAMVFTRHTGTCSCSRRVACRPRRSHVSPWSTCMRQRPSGRYRMYACGVEPGVLVVMWWVGGWVAVERLVGG
jgi:hypothetical protein